MSYLASFKRRIYVEVTDPLGGELGYGGPPIAVSHQFYYDTGYFGTESLTRLLTNEALFRAIECSATGSFERFTWRYKNSAYEDKNDRI